MDSAGTPSEQQWEQLVPNSSTPRAVKDHALKTLPQGLRYCVWMDNDKGRAPPRMRRGIFASQEFKAGAWFGPYEGSLILPPLGGVNNEEMWEIHCSGKLCHYVDSSKDEVANWMRYVSYCKEPAPHVNLLAYQHHGSIYYHCFTAIAVGEELKLCLRHFKLEDSPSGLQDQPHSCSVCRHMHGSHIFPAMRYTHTDTPTTKPVSRAKVTVSPDTAATKRRALNNKIDKLREKLKGESNDASIPASANMFDFRLQKDKFASSNLCGMKYDNVSSSGISTEGGQPESDSRLTLERGSSQPCSEKSVLDDSSSDQADGFPLLQGAALMSYDPKKLIAKHRDAKAVSGASKNVEPHPVGRRQESPSLVNLLSSPSCLSFTPVATGMFAGASTSDVQQGATSEIVKQPLDTDSTELSTEHLCSGDQGTKHYSGTLLLTSILAKDKCKARMKRVNKLLPNRRFYCVYCRWRLKDLYQFIRHKRSHLKYYHRTKGSDVSNQVRIADRGAMVLTGVGSRMFPCSVCNRSFKEVHTMKTHERSHANHTCHYCGRVFGSSTARIVHERTHTGERPYQCDQCPKAFRTSYMRTRHKQQCHMTERPYKCEYCNKKFKVKNAMTTHIKTHTHEKNLPCEVCGKNFGLPRDLLRHVKTHTDERPYQCEYCDKSYKQKSTLTTHVQKHFVGEFACKFCPLKFRTMQAHARHESVHTGIQPVFKRVEKPFPCRYCDRVFPRNVKRKVHERVHTGELPFQCDICQKAYSSKKGLESHMRTHSDERPYPCLICGKSFKERNTLKCHVRIHTGVRPFKCEQCDKTFRVSDALKKHRRSHSDERAYKCQQCEKAFKQLSALRKHERWHLGLRPHICNICGRDFVDRYRLRIHQSIHLEVRPHKCDMCDKSFTEACRLKRHLRDHENRREFQCEICCKKFNFKDQLETHVKTHSEHRPFQCQSCPKCFKNSSALHRHQRVHSDESYCCPVCNKCFKSMKSLKKHAVQHLDKEILPLDASSTIADLCGIIPPDTESSTGNEVSHVPYPHHNPDDVELMPYNHFRDQDTHSSQSHPNLRMYPKSLGMYPESSQAADSDQSTIVDEEESVPDPGPKGVLFPESTKDLIRITPLNEIKMERFSEDEQGMQHAK